MMEPSQYESALRRILWALRPYLDEIVVIGGWVPYLYRRYGGFASWVGRISLTSEVDVLVARPLPPDGRPSIPEILREATFRPAGSAGGMAVWEGDVMAGEKVEFLVPHTGTGREQGKVVPIPAQNGMGAIALAGLGFMREFRCRLSIPVTTAGRSTSLHVWVPQLGAYAVNKASTFASRRAQEGGGSSRRAKDLLYLRDLMAAGSEVVERIEADLSGMRRTEDARGATGEQIRHARNTLRLALDGELRRELPEVSRMLRERESGATEDAALADVRGHLVDLMEILDEYAG